jgi:hypothetical protein
MAKKKVENIKDDEMSLIDFFMNVVDYEAMDTERRNEIVQILMMLLACADGDRLNMNNVAALAERVSGGAMDFSGKPR